MKRTLQFIACASTCSVLAMSASAQERDLHYTHRSDYSRSHSSNGWRANPSHDAAKASDIIGMTVKNYQDEKLGKVDDLAVDIESGRIVHAILSTGGFMGVAGASTAVPPGTLHRDADKKVLLLDADKAKLKAAPEFDASKWDEATQSNRVVEVYTYYGEQPYFAGRGGITNDSRTDITDAKLASTMPRNMDGTINTEAGRTVDRVRNEEIARHATNGLNSIRNADGTWTRDQYMSRRGTNSSWSKLGYVEKASKLIGKPVKNLQEEKVGKVENLVVDLPSGRVVVVVVSSGGFMGIGDELSAVPPTAFTFDAARDTLHLDVSKEMLVNSPHFKANQWPDFNQSNYVERTYLSYRVEPYSASYFDNDRRDVRDHEGKIDTTKDADNTARNVRDRDDRTLTPLDQGNSQADVDTTAQIRKEIIADKNMSVNAKNVKIITTNGRVTLRGPVANESERQRIGEIAGRIANVGNVNNQLEAQRSRSSND